MRRGQPRSPMPVRARSSRRTIRRSAASGPGRSSPRRGTSISSSGARRAARPAPRPRAGWRSPNSRPCGRTCSTTIWAAASTATRPTARGGSHTSRKCSPTRRCSRPPTSTHSAPLASRDGPTPRVASSPTWRATSHRSTGRVCRPRAPHARGSGAGGVRRARSGVRVVAALGRRRLAAPALSGGRGGIPRTARRSRLLRARVPRAVRCHAGAALARARRERHGNPARTFLGRFRRSLLRFSAGRERRERPLERRLRRRRAGRELGRGRGALAAGHAARARRLAPAGRALGRLPRAPALARAERDAANGRDHGTGRDAAPARGDRGAARARGHALARPRVRDEAHGRRRPGGGERRHACGARQAGTVRRGVAREGRARRRLRVRGLHLPASRARAGRAGGAAGRVNPFRPMREETKRVVDHVWTIAKRVALAMLVASSLAARARAQTAGADPAPAAEKLVQATAAPVSVAAGGRATIVVKLAIRPSWHVNANPPALEYNIPTKVAIQGAAGLAPGTVRYPAGKKEKFGFEDAPLLVYDGAVEVTVPLAAAAGARSQTLSGTVEFQACNDQ